MGDTTEAAFRKALPQTYQGLGDEQLITSVVACHEALTADLRARVVALEAERDKAEEIIRRCNALGRRIDALERAIRRPRRA